MFTILGEMRALMATSGTATTGEYAQALQTKPAIPKIALGFEHFGKWVGDLLLFVAVTACFAVA